MPDTEAGKDFAETLRWHREYYHNNGNDPEQIRAVNEAIDAIEAEVRWKERIPVHPSYIDTLIIRSEEHNPT